MVDKGYAFWQCANGLNGEHTRPDEDPDSDHDKHEQSERNKRPASFFDGRLL
jgi:hypothetical protein